MSFFKTFDKEHTEEVEVSIEWGYGLEGENGRRIKGNEYSGVEMRNENGEPYTAYEDEEGNHLFWWDEANRDAEQKLKEKYPGVYNIKVFIREESGLPAGDNVNGELIGPYAIGYAVGYVREVTKPLAS